MPGRPSKETEAGARRPLPPFTEKHERLRAEIRRFVAEELRPHAGEWEDARWFPNDVFTRMAELGLLGLKYPRELGGRGGDHLDDAVLTEELSRCGSGGVAAGIGAHIGIATPPIWSFGTEGQKQRFLAPAIRGEKIAALGITEPGAGSDVAGLRTSARRVDGGYVVNGSKTFITNGVRADFVVTAVKTTEEGGQVALGAHTRAIADGLVWKALRYDRAAITILGDGTRVDRLATTASGSKPNWINSARYGNRNMRIWA
jgi:acyl-CoA dehydrogenase